MALNSSGTYYLTMKKHAATFFSVLGVSLILLPLCLLGIPTLLHRTGVIQEWDGFGVFVMGLALLPWLVGFGSLAILIAVFIKRDNWKSPSVRIGFSILVASLIFLGFLFGYRFPRMFPIASSVVPRELKEGHVLLGGGRFSKEIFYSQPNVGVITDIEQDETGRLTILGRNGAAFVGQDRALIKSLSFEQCFSDVVLVDLGTQNPSFLCRGLRDAKTRLSNAAGKTLWSYGGDTPGVDDAAGGDLGSGVKGVVVGFDGDGGIHLLDSAGREIWQRHDDSDVWHVEIVASAGRPHHIILHSNTRGELTIRNWNGEILARNPIPKIYLGRFSLTAWSGDRHRDKIVASHFDSIYVLDMNGGTIARLPAQVHGGQDPWMTYGTPLRASSSVSYYVSLQRYESWERSVLHVYDDQNQPVYEEVLTDDCAALRTVSNKSGFQDFLLGCEGKVLRYSLREKLK